MFILYANSDSKSYIWHSLITPNSEACSDIIIWCSPLFTYYAMRCRHDIKCSHVVPQLSCRQCCHTMPSAVGTTSNTVMSCHTHLVRNAAMLCHTSNAVMPCYTIPYLVGTKLNLVMLWHTSSAQHHIHHTVTYEVGTTLNAVIPCHILWGTAPHVVMLWQPLSALHQTKSCNAIPILWALHHRRSCCDIRCWYNTEFSHAVTYAVGTTPDTVMLWHTMSALHQISVMLLHTLSALHKIQACCDIRRRHYTKFSHAVTDAVSTTHILSQAVTCIVGTTQHFSHAVTYDVGTKPNFSHAVTYAVGTTRKKL